MPRATTRLSREEKKAMTRSRLLDAAAAVFARKGFYGASLDDVAEEAGLTKGAVYSNFESKDDLISALLAERLDHAQYTIPGLVDPGASREEQANQAAALFMQMFERDRDMHVLGVEFMAHLARNPHLARRESYHRRVADMAADMESRATEHGASLPMPARDLVIALFALGQGLIMERLVNPDDVPDDLFARVLNLLLSSSQVQDESSAAGKDSR
ncbi:MAG: TetR/AcrR family transcriptional regulator [Actinomycetes bacterium]